MPPYGPSINLSLKIGFCIIQRKEGGNLRPQMICSVAFILRQLMIYQRWLLQVVKTGLLQAPVDTEAVQNSQASNQNLPTKKLSSHQLGKAKVMRSRQQTRGSCLPLEHLFSQRRIPFLIPIHLPGVISAHLTRLLTQAKPCRSQS